MVWPSRDALTSRLMLPPVSVVDRQRAQRPIALLGIRVARRDDGVLFRFDHQPAAITMPLQARDDRREIDRAVAGHGERAVDHRIEKAPVAVARQLDDLRAARPCNARGTRGRCACRAPSSGSPPANVMWPASNSRPTASLVQTSSGDRRRPASRHRRPCDGGTRRARRA